MKKKNIIVALYCCYLDKAKKPNELVIGYFSNFDRALLEYNRFVNDFLIPDKCVVHKIDFVKLNKKKLKDQPIDLVYYNINDFIDENFESKYKFNEAYNRLKEIFI